MQAAAACIDHALTQCLLSTLAVVHRTHLAIKQCTHAVTDACRRCCTRDASASWLLV